MSYALVYAEEGTREGVFEAIRKRRAYAATDNIVVEYWIGDAFMGEEIDAAGEIPEIRAQLIGTDKFRELALIRNNRVIYTAKPDKKEVDFSYTDREPEAGTNFYYLRAIQANDEIAWSSPIWVNRK